MIYHLQLSWLDNIQQILNEKMDLSLIVLRLLLYLRSSENIEETCIAMHAACCSSDLDKGNHSHDETSEMENVSNALKSML